MTEDCDHCGKPHPEVCPCPTGIGMTTYTYTSEDGETVEAITLPIYTMCDGTIQPREDGK